MNNKLISTTVIKNASGFMSQIDIKFLNGNLTIPAVPGGYVVAPGCGSGKTTAIKEIIRQSYNEGILYSAFTIKECNEMYEYCKSLVDQNEVSLTLDDIILLHSDYTHEGTDNNLWRNNIKELYNKKIIICTHAKLLSTDPRVFIKYRRNPVYTGGIISMIEDCYTDYLDPIPPKGVFLSRQLLLIDELPSIQSLSVNMTKAGLRLLGLRNTYKDWKLDDKGRMIIGDIAIKGENAWRRADNFSDMMSYYEENKKSKEFIELDGTDDPSEFRRNLILSLIYENFNYYMNADKNSENINISYNLSDLLIPSMNNRIILFEGTGDLITNKDYALRNYIGDGFIIKDLKYIIYPNFIIRNNKKFYFKMRLMDSNTNIYSRNYRLSHRSSQEMIMDSLINIDYFGVKIYREIPFICNNKNQTYYLVDYYIPECRLIIELDSSYHNKDTDKIRDEFMNSLGLEVLRFYNFLGKKEEIEKIKEKINNTKDQDPIRINYYYEDNKEVVDNCMRKLINRFTLLTSEKP